MTEVTIKAMISWFEERKGKTLKLNNKGVDFVVKALDELKQYRAIGTVSEFNQLKEINEKITEAVNGQLIAGKNNYKEAYECFHKIVDIVQGRIDWSEGKE